MCGICGVVVPERGSVEITDALVTRMRDAIVHRGPDGAGNYVRAQVGLGHRRLSIVDVAHGQQPMLSPDERFAVVYNGEVFNHPQLKTELEAQGVEYRTWSDTETVLHLFRRQGARAVEQLRGMFAIAIWDENERRLWLARDRFGVKPLYYVHREDGSLWFASEIKALLAGGAVRAELNAAAMPDFLANHAPSGNETLFAGVRRLPAGHTLTWQDGRIEITRYWDLTWPAAGETQVLSPAKERELVAEYRERLTEAVRLRLMADVPLGSFLSGGIDSAAITAIMSNLIDEPVRTFSVAFAEREANELEYAREVATRFRTDHHEVVVTPEQFWESVPRLVWHEDEPIAHPSSVALNFVSRLAAEHVKVVLTGEGSDETLAGYNRYRVTMYNLALGRRYDRMVPGVMRRAVRAALGGLPERSRTRQRVERTFLWRGGDLDSLYFDNFAVFDRARQHALLGPAFRERIGTADPYQAYHDALGACTSSSMLDRLLYADTKTYLHELLMKQDQMSMAASIESRVPFLDHPTVEWVTRLPEPMKLRGVTTKWILREAMKGTLPERILSRKKMGFPVPVGAWLRQDWSLLLQEYVVGPRTLARQQFSETGLRQLVAEHVSGARNHAERLWALITLEIWQRIFLDGEDVQHISLRPARS